MHIADDPVLCNAFATSQDKMANVGHARQNNQVSILRQGLCQVRCHPQVRAAGVRSHMNENVMGNIAKFHNAVLV
jgi:hypothetical protein